MPRLVTHSVTRVQRPDLWKRKPELQVFSGRAIECLVVTQPTIRERSPFSRQHSLMVWYVQTKRDAACSDAESQRDEYGTCENKT